VQALRLSLTSADATFVATSTLPLSPFDYRFLQRRAEFFVDIRNRFSGSGSVLVLLV